MKVSIIVEVDIDSLSKADQIKLIKEFLSPDEIIRTIRSDLFPLNRLIARVKVLQDFCPDIFDDSWRN